MIAPHARPLPSIHEPASTRPPVPRKSLAVVAAVTGLMVGLVTSAGASVVALLAALLSGRPDDLAFSLRFVAGAGALAGGWTAAGTVAGATIWHALRWHWPKQVHVDDLAQVTTKVVALLFAGPLLLLLALVNPYDVFTWVALVIAAGAWLGATTHTVMEYLQRVAAQNPYPEASRILDASTG